MIAVEEESFMATKGKIRFATKEDAAAVLHIYEGYITNTAVTFETEVPTLEAFEERMEHIMAGFPWLVCEINDRIAGYAYASKHGERAAYRWSADLSVYIDEKYHRCGIATALYTALLELLRQQGYYTVYAGVSTPNPKSEAFHEAYGFRNLGEFQNAGYKLGAWRGVTWFELPLAEYGTEPEEPVTMDALQRRDNCLKVFSEAEKRICEK